MQYAEALREVKKAETEVRDLKTDADRQASQLLREAERQANSILEAARTESEAAHAKALDDAAKKAKGDRTTKLAAGEKDAGSVRARASSSDFKAAADTLVANFEKHVSSK